METVDGEILGRSWSMAKGMSRETSSGAGLFAWIILAILWFEGCDHTDKLNKLTKQVQQNRMENDIQSMHINRLLEAAE